MKKNFFLILLITLFLSANASNDFPLLLSKKGRLKKKLKKIEIYNKFSGIRNIDLIYIINLEERKYKWQRMQEILKKNNLFANKLNAVNGWKLDRKKIKELNPLKRIGKGHTGTLLSHISVLYDAYCRNLDFIWVMEDDIFFLKDPHVLSNYIDKLNKCDPNWDILYTDFDSRNSDGSYLKALCITGAVRPNQNVFSEKYFLKRIKINNFFTKIRLRYGAYSMIVSKKGIQKILNYFDKNRFYTPYDIDIHFIPKINEYICNEEIVTHWWKTPYSDSTIPMKNKKK